MQQPMVQFLAKFGLYNLNIKCREAVHIFHWLWNGRNFCMNLSQFEHFFKEMDTYSSNGYQLVLLQLYLISTVMLEGLNLNIIWKSSKNTNTVGTPYNTNVGVQKIPDRAIWKPVVAKRNNTNPWSCSKPQILVTRDSRQVHMAEQPASRDRLGSKFLPSCIHHRLPDNSLISVNLQKYAFPTCWAT